MSNDVVVSVLLARGGSKGVPGKNLRPVGGISLVARSVLAARQANRVSGVYVSTDSPDIAAEGQALGARIIERPNDISGDTATSESGWLHALDEIRKDFPEVSKLVLLQCTSPFTTGADIDACLEALDSAGAACSLSVVEDLPFLWTTDTDGLGKGVNHDETKQRLRRQDMGPSFRESGAIYCVKVPEFEKTRRRFCGPVALHAVHHPPVEIDTLDELELCDTLARRIPGPRAPTILEQRLMDIRAVVTDFDGVHTDDLVTVDQKGNESVTVSRSDGMGVELLRKAGHWKLFILSKEQNPVVLRRAEKLQIECLNASDDKVSDLSDWLKSNQMDWKNLLYVGNDINDVEVLRRAGIAVCPCDANPAALVVSDWVVPVRGGQGVIRAIAELLLTKRKPA